MEATTREVVKILERRDRVDWNYDEERALERRSQAMAGAGRHSGPGGGACW